MELVPVSFTQAVELNLIYNLNLIMTKLDLNLNCTPRKRFSAPVCNETLRIPDTGSCPEASERDSAESDSEPLTA